VKITHDNDTIDILCMMEKDICDMTQALDLMYRLDDGTCHDKILKFENEIHHLKSKKEIFSSTFVHNDDIECAISVLECMIEFKDRKRDNMNLLIDVIRTHNT